MLFPELTEPGISAIDDTVASNNVRVPLLLAIPGRVRIGSACGYAAPADFGGARPEGVEISIESCNMEMSNVIFKNKVCEREFDQIIDDSIFFCLLFSSGAYN